MRLVLVLQNGHIVAGEILLSCFTSYKVFVCVCACVCARDRVT